MFFAYDNSVLMGRVKYFPKGAQKINSKIKCCTRLTMRKIIREIEENRREVKKLDSRKLKGTV